MRDYWCHRTCNTIDGVTNHAYLRTHGASQLPWIFLIYTLLKGKKQNSNGSSPFHSLPWQFTWAFSFSPVCLSVIGLGLWTSRFFIHHLCQAFLPRLECWRLIYTSNVVQFLPFRGIQFIVVLWKNCRNHDQMIYFLGPQSLPVLKRKKKSRQSKQTSPVLLVALNKHVYNTTSVDCDKWPITGQFTVLEYLWLQ